MRGPLVAACVLGLGLVSTLARADVLLGASAGQASFEGHASSVHFQESSFGWKVFAGFHMFKFFSVEAAYADLGSVDASGSGVAWHADAKLWDAFAVGNLPVGPVRLFAKAGFAHADVRTSGSASSSITHWDRAFGTGVAFGFGKHFALRAEYERFEISGFDRLSLWGAGIELRF